MLSRLRSITSCGLIYIKHTQTSAAGTAVCSRSDSSIDSGAEKDRDREYAFIKRLSPETRHMRFLAQINEPGAAMLNQLMDTDTNQRVAYIAQVHENGHLVKIGISRYAATREHECE